MFKTEPLYSSTSTGNPTGKNLNNLLADDDEPQAEAPSLIQQILSFFSKLWSPSTSDAEKLGYSYVYAEDGSLLGEYGSGGSNSTGTAQYIYLPTASGPMPIAAVIKGQTYAVHSDHLNTPRKLTQPDGQVAWQWAYSAFGDEQPTIGAKRFTSESTNPTTGATSIPEVTFNLRYPGQYFDKETKLHYNYFRTYAPSTGRYTQGDPIGLDGGWNRFAYVDGNPLSYTDPLGLWAVGDPLPQGVVNTSAGVGDGILATLSFGFASGQQIRNGLNIGSVDKCSPEYRAGQVAGTAATMAIYAGGAIPRTLTHFTTSAGAAGIAKSGSILPSTGLTLFGDGVYATAGSRLFVPGAATIPLTVSGAGFMRLVPNAAFLNGGSLQTGLIFAGYGAAANYNAESVGCTCK